MALENDLKILLGVDVFISPEGKTKLEKFKAGLSSVNKALLGFSAVIGGVAAATGVLFKNSADEGAKWGKLAKQTNMSTNALQEWSFAATRSGASSQAFQADLLNLQANLGASGALLNEELMSMASQMQGMDQAAALAFGKTKQLSQDTIQVLKQGPEAILAMRQQASQLGVIIPEDSIKDASEFNAKLVALEATIISLGNQVGMAFLPALGGLIDGFEKWIGENQKLTSQGLDKFTEGILAGFKSFWQVLEQIGAAFEPLLGFLSPFLEEMTSMETITQVVSGALLGLLAVFSPLILKFAAITAGVLLLATAFGDFINFIQGKDSQVGDFFNMFKERWPELYSSIEKAGTWIKENFISVLLDLWDVVQYVLGGLGSVFSTVLDKINALAGPVSNFFGSFKEEFPKIYGLLSSLANFVGNGLKLVFDIFVEDLKVKFEVLGVVIEKVFEIIKACVAKVESFLKFIDESGDFISETWESLKPKSSQNSSWINAMPMRGGTNNNTAYYINQNISGYDSKQIATSAIEALPGQASTTPSSVPQGA